MKNFDPEAVLIGEVWEDVTNKQSYGQLRKYFWGHELDATMNYPFREMFLRFLLGKIEAEDVHRRVTGAFSLSSGFPQTWQRAVEALRARLVYVSRRFVHLLW